MQRAAIERLLPGVFQRALSTGSPLSAVLDAIQALQEPDEQILARLPEVFNARRTDERYLTMLAHWLNLARLFPARESEALPDWRPQRLPVPAGCMRELVANAARLSQQRGTTQGLQSFLEIATGVSPFRIEERVCAEDGAIVPFHVRLLAPQAARACEELIERIVEQEKPAYVTWELAWV
jgi:phage tail-like protein